LYLYGSLPTGVCSVGGLMSYSVVCSVGGLMSYCVVCDVFYLFEPLLPDVCSVGGLMSYCVVCRRSHKETLLCL
jgi:hypothetical protein